MILLGIQLASPIANKVDLYFALICDDFKIEVIFLLKQVLDKSCKDPNPLRHRIEHLGLCTVEQIEQAAKLNLALSFFVAHLYFYGKTYTEHIFGPERTNRWTPLSAATKVGLRWSIHLACSRRSDSGERCKVKGVPLYFSSFSLLHTALHYLNAWNRLFLILIA